jgi:hypothetical protein
VSFHRLFLSGLLPSRARFRFAGSLPIPLHTKLAQSRVRPTCLQFPCLTDGAQSSSVHQNCGRPNKWLLRCSQVPILIFNGILTEYARPATPEIAHPLPKALFTAIKGVRASMRTSRTFLELLANSKFEISASDSLSERTNQDDGKS